MELEVNVEGVEKTLNEIERDLHRGMERSMDNLVDNAKGRARRVIAETDSIFNAEVYKGFKDAETKNNGSRIRAKVYNDVGHADALEHGATYGSKGPPVAALLPWVARKMHWSPDFDISDSYDDPDGGSPTSAINRIHPDEWDEENWETIPTDYNEARSLSNANVVKTQYTNHPIRRRDSSYGLILGWDKDRWAVAPTGSRYDVYRRNSDDEWEYIDGVDDAQYIPKDSDIVGHKPGTEDGEFSYEFYRTRDYPSDVTDKIRFGNWNQSSDWDGKIGDTVVYRDSSGLVYEGTVTEVTDDTVEFYDGNFTHTYIRNNGVEGSYDLLAVEAGDKNPENRLFGVTANDVLEGDRVFVLEDDGTVRRLEVVEKNGDGTIDVLDGSSRFNYDYEQILSVVRSGPVSNQLGEFERGDRVSFYDEDEDSLIDIILTGGTDFTGQRYDAVLENDKAINVQVHQGRFVEWESSPALDDSKVADSMRRTTVTTAQEARDENLYSFQKVVIYEPFDGDTRNVELKGSPWNDSLIAQNSLIGEIDIDDSDWEIKAVQGFDSLTNTKQRNLIERHIDDEIDISNPEDGDVSHLKDYVKDITLENYSDKEEFSRTFFSWNSLNIEDDRAHAGPGNSKTAGWEMQMNPRPTNEYETKTWQRTFGHEFGHGYNQPTEARQTTLEPDPIGYNFAHPWNKQNDPDYEHIFEDGLPKWEFHSTSSLSDRVHGYKEMYMFTDDDIGDKIDYDSSTGELTQDNRNELTPYGFDSWGDEVQAKARAEAKGTTASTERSDFSTREITDRQIFGGDEFALEKDEAVVLQIDGEERYVEYKRRDGSNSIFSENPDEDVPTSAESIGFEDLDGNNIYLYVTDDGDVLDTEYNGDTTHLTENGNSFVGKAGRLLNYDESRDEFPDLVETEKPKRLQEAANMAWWYQVNFIEADTTDNKDRSDDVILSRGYSSTMAEEVMSTFTEGLAHPNPDKDVIDDFKIVMNRYPFFMEELLKQRQPVSQDIEDILMENGFL